MALDNDRKHLRDTGAYSPMPSDIMDSVILLLSRESLSAHRDTLLDAMETCTHASNSMCRNIQAKVNAVQRIKDLADEMIGIEALISRKFANLLTQICQDCYRSPSNSEVGKTAASVELQFDVNRVHMEEKLKTQIVSPAEELLRDLEKDNQTEVLRKKMEKALRKLCERRRTLTSRISSAIQMGNGKDSNIKNVHSARHALIEYFSYLAKKNLALSRQVISSTTLLNRCIEGFIGRQYALTTTLSKTVVTELQQDGEREAKLIEEQLEDLVSFRIVSHGSQAGLSTVHHLTQASANCQENKVGPLWKSSPGNLVKRWKKKRCRLNSDCLIISSDNDVETDKETRIRLITSSIKMVDEANRTFTLVSGGSDVGKVTLMASSSEDLKEWVSAIQAMKLKQINKSIFDWKPYAADNGEVQTSNLTTDKSVEIIQRIRQMPGNKHCCDCEAEDPEWISLNFGILLCIECCGVHRELGAHLSRTQSLTMDKIDPDNLIIAQKVGNRTLNAVFCPNLEYRAIIKYSPTGLRHNYIRNKYHSMAYVDKSRPLNISDLFRFIDNRDFSGLLAAYAHNVPFLAENTEHQKRWNALMYSIGNENGLDLAVTQFLLYNCQRNERKPSDSANRSQTGLNYSDSDGETVLHLCVYGDHRFVLKMAIAVGASVEILNRKGQNAYDLARALNRLECLDVLAKENIRRSLREKPKLHDEQHIRKASDSAVFNRQRAISNKDPDIIRRLASINVSDLEL